MAPLISCIMPTSIKRKQFIPRALRCWFEQTHPNKELIIVSEDDLSTLIPDDPRIRLIRCAPGLTVGHKRNIACEAALGTFIAHWDDDDWSYPGRLGECAAAFHCYQIEVVGYHTISYFELTTKTARTFTFKNGWVHGTSLVYNRSYWQGNKFRTDIPSGEDNFFLADTPPHTIVRLDGTAKMVACDHPGNTFPRRYEHEWKVIGSIPTEGLLNSQRPWKILFGMLSWNRADVTLSNLDALKREAWRLECFGHEPYIAVCDNGSTDGTQQALRKHKKDVNLILNKKNLGSAVGRNQLIDYAVEIGADYILFMDCDVTVIPGSVMEMMKWFQTNGAASLGANPYKYTDDPLKATKWCPPITSVAVSPHLSLTQYGLFPVPLLKKIPFDPHFGPGWGAEDNDLAMAIEDQTNLLNYTFDNTCYLHRHAHGSLALMEKEGIDVDANCHARMDYIIKKWGKTPKFEKIVTWFRHAKAKNELRPETTMVA